MSGEVFLASQNPAHEITPLRNRLTIGGSVQILNQTIGVIGEGLIGRKIGGYEYSRWWLEGSRKNLEGLSLDLDVVGR